MSWPTVKLDEIAESISYGHTASANPNADGPKFLRITDIQEGMVHWDSVPRCECRPIDSAKFRLAIGDIVFARTGATTGKSFLLRDISEACVFASYLIRVRPQFDRIDPGFLARFFETQDYWSQINKSSSGTAQGGVNASKLKSLCVPLPPLPEQRRISAILDKADTLRAKRREAIAKCDQLLQSVFLDMFGDPVTNPKGWPIGLIRDLLGSVKYGTSQKAFQSGAFPILRMNNITYSGEMDLTVLKYLDLAEKDIEKHTVQPGDILFNRTNSKELVGKTAVYTGPTPMAYAGYLVRGRVNSHATPEYISAYLNSPWGKQKLQAMCKSIVGMANINAKEFAAISIAHPPLAVQHKFTTRVTQIRNYRSALSASANDLDVLFASIQQRAFLGQQSQAA